jgi:hypothetical protein
MSVRFVVPRFSSSICAAGAALGPYIAGVVPGWDSLFYILIASSVTSAMVSVFDLSSVMLSEFMALDIVLEQNVLG